MHRIFQVLKFQVLPDASDFGVENQISDPKNPWVLNFSCFLEVFKSLQGRDRLEMKKKTLFSEKWAKNASNPDSVHFFICFFQFEDINYKLYDIPWYTYKPKHRKYLILLLSSAQRPVLFKSGILKCVNFSWYSQLVYDAYSMGVVLEKFV